LQFPTQKEEDTPFNRVRSSLLQSFFTLQEKEIPIMKAHYLGHVVFYVKNIEASLKFYRDLLGFQEIGTMFNGKAAVLTSGRTHHELLLIQVGDTPGPIPSPRRGLYHIGIKIGDSLDELRTAK